MLQAQLPCQQPQASHVLSEAGKDKPVPFHLPFGHGLCTGLAQLSRMGWPVMSPAFPAPSQGKFQGVRVKDERDSRDGGTQEHTSAHLPCGLRRRNKHPLGLLCLLGVCMAPPAAPTAPGSASLHTEPAAGADSQALGKGYAVLHLYLCRGILRW